MSRRDEAPVRTHVDGAMRGHVEEVSTHPAFGNIVLTRTMVGGKGAGVRLFGSDLGHSTMVRMDIRHAEQHRQLSEDRVFARENVVTLEMSEAQWARFVASSGMGSGTPCTFRQLGPETIPGIAAPPATKRERHGEEMADSLRRHLDALRQHVAELGSIATAGKGPMSITQLRDLHKEIARHVDYLPGSVQFVYDQFARATEEVAEDAKTEVEAFIDNTARRLGLEQMRQMAPRLPGADAAPLTIDGGDDA